MTKNGSGQTPLPKQLTNLATLYSKEESCLFFVLFFLLLTLAWQFAHSANFLLVL